MLILASNSPRRKQLLSLIRGDFRTSTAWVDESTQSEELPWEYVQRVAEKKACAVADFLKVPVLEDLVIIGADTTVVVEDNQLLNHRTQGDKSHLVILGKPKNDADAARMLYTLRGRSHHVFTGLVIIKPSNGMQIRDLCDTEVFMRDYTDQEIRSYISSGDPFDKAGAYAIQHDGFQPAEKLEGCYANVMGLPLCHLTRIFRVLNIAYELDISHVCQEYLGFTCQVHTQILSKEIVL